MKAKPPIAPVAIWCIACLLPITKDVPLGATIAHLDNRSGGWWCPRCWQERKDRERLELQSEDIHKRL